MNGRHRREAQPSHDVAQEPEDEHEPDIEHLPGRRVGAEHGHQEDRREEQPVVHGQHVAGEPDQQEAQAEHQEVGEDQADEDRIEHRRLLRHQHWPGRDPVDHEGAEHEGRLDIARNAERHERDQVRTVGGAVAGFGGGDAAQRAPADRHLVPGAASGCASL